MTIATEVAPLSKLLKALADDTRLRMVALLAHGELCVCHFEGALAMPQPTVSRNLAVLRHADIVQTRRVGTWIYYRLAEQADPAAARVLTAVVVEFATQSVLAEDVARLRGAMGPASCR